MVKNIYESVSVKDGVLTATLTNLSLDESYDIDMVLTEAAAASVTGEIVTGAMNAHNTFDTPENVKLESFDDAKITESGLTVKLPARSVVKLSVKLA